MSRHANPGRRRAHAALQFGVTEHRTKDALQLLSTDEARARQVLAGTLPLSKALAAARREKQLQLIDGTKPPEGTYRTIVIDPPWAFTNDSFRSSAASQYVTMSVEELRDLPVEQLAAPECHLHLWVPSLFVADGIALLEHWGFRFITTLVWDKQRLGLGHYFRNAHELVLFGVRGRAPPRSVSVGTVFTGKVTRHSQKPIEFFEHVVKVSHAPYLEMFARAPREGWTTWGAEAGGRAPIHKSAPFIKGVAQ